MPRSSGTISISPVRSSRLPRGAQSQHRPAPASEAGAADGARQRIASRSLRHHARSSSPVSARLTEPNRGARRSPPSTVRLRPDGHPERRRPPQRTAAAGCRTTRSRVYAPRRSATTRRRSSVAAPPEKRVCRSAHGGIQLLSPGGCDWQRELARSPGVLAPERCASPRLPLAACTPPARSLSRCLDRHRTRSGGEKNF